MRVIHHGAWGFAAGVFLTHEEAARVTETAVAVALVAAEMTTSAVEIAPEPVYDDVTYVSSYDVNPLDVPTAEKAAVLIDWTDRLRTGAAVDHASAFLMQVQENKYYADLAGTRTTQQRVRLHPGFEAMGTGADNFDSMASIAPLVGRGWEYLTDGSYDWDDEIEQVPERSPRSSRRRASRPAATTSSSILQPVAHDPRVDRSRHRAGPGAGLRGQLRRDLVRDVRRSPQGCSTAPIMHVTGDRTVEHGLATTGYDDEGVAAQSWDIVKDGVLVATTGPGDGPDEARAERRPLDGCAYADFGHIAIQRMANVSSNRRPAARAPRS